MYIRVYYSHSFHCRLAGILLRKGADPNWLARDGISALHLAVGTNHAEACHFIEDSLQRGADPNIRSSEGLTPVHIAASWGHSQHLELLVSCGGDPDLLDDEGLSAFELAYRSTEEGAELCIQILFNVENYKDENIVSNLYCDQEVSKGREKCEDSCDSCNPSFDDEQSSTSFYTAEEDERFSTDVDELCMSTFFSANETVISFPKLQPWTAPKETQDLEQTVVYHVKNLSLQESPNKR